MKSSAKVSCHKLQPLPTPKSHFCSIEIHSTVYVIGGSDDLDTWYSLEITRDQSHIHHQWGEICPLNIGRFSASWWTFDDKYIYVFGGRAAYGTILNSIEMLDSDLNLYKQFNAVQAWKMIPLTLETSIYDWFWQQIDSGKILILGGKYNTDGKNTSKWYALGRRIWI